MHLSRQYTCWSLRCSWSIACRHCSNCILTIDLTPGFNGLGKLQRQLQDETRVISVWWFGATYIRDFAVSPKLFGGIHLRAGARPTNGISIEFEIRSKFGVLLFKICSSDHNEILHTSRQCNCRDVCKISLWSVESIFYQSMANFGRILNSIEILLVGRAPGRCFTTHGELIKWVFMGLKICWLFVHHDRYVVKFVLKIRPPHHRCWAVI